MKGKQSTPVPPMLSLSGACLLYLAGACRIFENRCYTDMDEDFLFEDSSHVCKGQNNSVLITLSITEDESERRHTFFLEEISKYPLWMNCFKTNTRWQCGRSFYYCPNCANNTGYWNWATEPKEEEDCIRYRQDGKIETTPCSNKHNVVCVDNHEVTTPWVSHKVTTPRIEISTPWVSRGATTPWITHESTSELVLSRVRNKTDEPGDSVNYAIDYLRSAFFDLEVNVCPPNHVMREILVPSLISCAAHCLSLKSPSLCTSFNFFESLVDEQSHLCQLNQLQKFATLQSPLNNISRQTNCRHYKVKDVGFT